MNFNQGAGNPSQQPFRGQRPNFPMLPPQFQNLTPQQLQELKNQPQFQNMLRSYFQRQQIQQQQQGVRQDQAPLQQGQSQMQASQQNQNMSQNLNQNLNLNPRMFNQNPAYLQQQQKTQRPPQGMMGMQAPNGQASGMKYANQTPQSLAQMQQRNAPPQMAQKYMKAPAAVGGLVGGGISPGGVPLAVQGSVGSLMAVGASSGVGGIGGAGLGGASALGGVSALGGAGVAGLASFPTSMAVVPAETVPAPPPTIKEVVKIPPGFAPDSVSRVLVKPLKSATEWSEKLKSEGEEVPTDVRIYEHLIKKDSNFTRKSTVQAYKNKGLMDRMTRDIKTYKVIKQLRMNAISASAKNQYNNSIWGDGYQGYGNGVSNTATQVILPPQNKSFSKVPDIRFTDRQMNERVLKGLTKPKHLVPVRLDFDQERDRFKLRDTFLWDLNDDTYPLENFVCTLLEDYKFISEQHAHTVLAAVNEQIKDYRVKPNKTMGELRVPIKIDLIINNTQFTDQFEWDILNFGESDPEDFATIVTDELSLPGEFATAIAFSIREQAQLYHKALFLVGYTFDGSFVREDEIRSHLLPALRVVNTDGSGGVVEDFVSTLRNPGMVADFSPSMSKLTQLEIEKIDKEMERESRRRRRHFNNESAFSYNENGPSAGVLRGTASRRSGVHTGRGVKTTLPDLSDIPKNFRTPMPSSVLPGGIDLGVPDIFGYNELIINRTQVKNPDYRAPGAPGMVTSFRDSDSFYVKIRLPRRMKRRDVY